jgi:hypothetical protein
MTGFTDFVQTELPKRPFVAADGAAGQVLVRSTNPLAAREMVWADSAGSGPGNLDGGAAATIFMASEAVDGGGANG